MSSLYTDVFETELQARLRNPEASFALSHWLISKRDRLMPEEQAFAHSSLEWLKQDLMIIRKNEANELYYAWYGSRISHHAGFDMTGKKVSEFKGDLGVFYQNLYEGIFLNPKPVGTVHRLGNFKERPMWERVLLPVAKAGVLDAIYVVNRALDLDHDFKLVAALNRNSSIIALQFEHDETGKIVSGIIIGANKAACKMCNRRLDEMVGASMHDCFPGIVEKGLWQRYLDVSASQEPCNFTLSYDLDGMNGTFDVTLSPYRDGILIDFILTDSNA